MRDWKRSQIPPPLPASLSHRRRTGPHDISIDGNARRAASDLHQLRGMRHQLIETALRMMYAPKGEWVDRRRRRWTRRLSASAAKQPCPLSPFAIGKPTPTSIALSATASAFGGSTTLSASVSPAGVAGSVVFSVNGSTTAVPAVYNQATGVATAANYLHGLAARATAYVVKAVFTATPTNFAGRRASPMPVPQRHESGRNGQLQFRPLSQPYDGTVKTVQTTTTPAGLPVNLVFTGTPQEPGSSAGHGHDQRRQPKRARRAASSSSPRRQRTPSTGSSRRSTCRPPR